MPADNSEPLDMCRVPLCLRTQREVFPGLEHGLFPPHLGMVWVPGEGREDAADGSLLPGLLDLLRVDLVMAGAAAAEDQGHLAWQEACRGTRGGASTQRLAPLGWCPVPSSTPQARPPPYLETPGGAAGGARNSGRGRCPCRAPPGCRGRRGPLAGGSWAPCVGEMKRRMARSKERRETSWQVGIVRGAAVALDTAQLGTPPAWALGQCPKKNGRRKEISSGRSQALPRCWQPHLLGESVPEEPLCLPSCFQNAPFKRRHSSPRGAPQRATCSPATFPSRSFSPPGLTSQLLLG